LPGAEPPLEGAALARFREGLACFERGEWFAAHEHWEDAWKVYAGADRSFLQGLIQASVALYHRERGNANGFARQRVRALEKLRQFPDRWWGLEIAAVRDLLTSLSPDRR